MNPTARNCRTRLFDIAVCQHLGDRGEQEDYAQVYTQGQQALAVLADGMGGHAHGREAAEAAVGAFGRRWRALTNGNGATGLDLIWADCFERARLAVLQTGGNACLVACLLMPGAVTVDCVWKGDARAFSIDPELKRMVGLTTPHRYPPPMPQNFVARSVGGEEAYERTGLPWMAHGRLILASDGVWDAQRSPNLVECCPRGRVARESAVRLVSQAVGRKEPGDIPLDNATAVVIRRRA